MYPARYACRRAPGFSCNLGIPLPYLITNKVKIFNLEGFQGICELDDKGNLRRLEVFLLQLE